MKKYTYASVVLVLLSLLSFAFTTQKKLTEGVVDFAITFSDLSPEMKEAEAMLPKTLTMYFKGQSFRGEMPSAMGNTITMYNAEKKEYYVLMDMMGQKMAIKQTEQEMKQEQKKESVKNLKVTLSRETKVIAGYTCNKAIISFDIEGKSEKLECFYTPMLPSSSNNNSAPGFDQIKGFMMEYGMNMGGIKMKITAQKVREQKVNSNLFNVPEGYTIKTKEELQQMNPGGEGN